MGSVIYDKSASLDGFIAGANMRIEAGLGDDGERLHEWAVQDQAGTEMLERGRTARRGDLRAPHVRHVDPVLGRRRSDRGGSGPAVRAVARRAGRGPRGRGGTGAR